jgi:hypothetical protein
MAPAPEVCAARAISGIVVALLTRKIGRMGSTAAGMSIVGMDPQYDR